MNENSVGRHLWISGCVQGIGFRWFMCEEAARLGVSGWVRNRRDGRVEAQIFGSHLALAALIHWASLGPPGARVETVWVEEIALLPQLESFRSLPTI